MQKFSECVYETNVCQTEKKKTPGGHSVTQIIIFLLMAAVMLSTWENETYRRKRSQTDFNLTCLQDISLSIHSQWKDIIWLFTMLYVSLF